MTEKGLKELVFESHRMLAEQSVHLRWICTTLEEMKRETDGLENRVRHLESWQDRHAGRERRLAGAGGVAGAAMGTLAGSVLSLLDLVK